MIVFVRPRAACVLRSVVSLYDVNAHTTGRRRDVRSSKRIHPMSNYGVSHMPHPIGIAGCWLVECRSRGPFIPDVTAQCTDYTVLWGGAGGAGGVT